MFFELLFNMLEGTNKGAKSYNIVMGTLMGKAKGYDKEQKLQQKLKDIKFKKSLDKAKEENKDLDTSDFDESIDSADEATKESQDSK